MTFDFSCAETYCGITRDRSSVLALRAFAKRHASYTAPCRSHK